MVKNAFDFDSNVGLFSGQSISMVNWSIGHVMLVVRVVKVGWQDQGLLTVLVALEKETIKFSTNSTIFVAP